LSVLNQLRNLVENTWLEPYYAANQSSKTVVVGNSDSLINEIAAWHERWDETGATMRQHSLLADELWLSTQDVYRDVDLVLALNIDVYARVHDLNIGLASNLIERLVHSEPGLAIEPSSMDRLCDLPDEGTVEEELALDLSRLEFACMVLDITGHILANVREYAEDTWISSKGIDQLVEPTMADHEFLEWLGDWHIRWNEGGDETVAPKELIDEIKSNAVESFALEPPYDLQVAIYRDVHILLDMITFALAVEEIWFRTKSDISTLGDPGDCALSSVSDIADEDVVHAEIIDKSCVYVQDTIELLGIVRNLASETWLEEFLRLDD